MVAAREAWLVAGEAEEGVGEGDALEGWEGAVEAAAEDVGEEADSAGSAGPSGRGDTLS